MVPRYPAQGAIPRVVVRLVLVLAGVSFFASVLWTFFPNLLGLSQPPVEGPARVAVPFFVAFIAGILIGFLAPADAMRLTQFSIGPGLLLGGLLLFGAALRPHHLLIVVALVVVYGAAAFAGAVLGRMGGRRAVAGSQP